MAKYTYVVFTDAVDGTDDEFNEWYDTTHVHDVLKVPGFVGAQRFKIADTQRGTPFDLGTYLALYEIDTDDIEGAIAELSRRVGTPAMVMSETLSDRKATAIYEAIGDRVSE